MITLISQMAQLEDIVISIENAKYQDLNHVNDYLDQLTCRTRDLHSNFQDRYEKLQAIQLLLWYADDIDDMKSYLPQLREALL